MMRNIPAPLDDADSIRNFLSAINRSECSILPTQPMTGAEVLDAEPTTSKPPIDTRSGAMEDTTNSSSISHANGTEGSPADVIPSRGQDHMILGEPLSGLKPPQNTPKTMPSSPQPALRARASSSDQPSGAIVADALFDYVQGIEVSTLGEFPFPLALQVPMQRRAGLEGGTSSPFVHP